MDLEQLAEILGAHIAVRPQNSTRIRGIAAPDGATAEMFTFIDKEEYLTELRNEAGVLLTSSQIYESARFKSYLQNRKGAGVPAPAVLFCEKPYAAAVTFLARLEKESGFEGLDFGTGVHPSAIVHSTARVDATATLGPCVVVGKDAVIEKNVIIMPGSYVGRGVRVGEGAVLFPHVTVLANTQVGRRTRIFPGAVIGSEGFGFYNQDGSRSKVPHIGRVVLGDGVEVGSNSTIARGTIGDTTLHNNVALDSLVQVAHNCTVGENSVMCSFVGLSGNTRVGRDCTFAGQVGTKGHVTIGDRVVVGAQSGISKDLASDQEVKGYPPIPVREFLKIHTYVQRLPKMFQRLKKVEVKNGIDEGDE